MNRINCFETKPNDLADKLGWAENLDTSEVAAAVIALCGIVQGLKAQVADLENNMTKVHEAVTTSAPKSGETTFTHAAEIKAMWGGYND